MADADAKREEKRTITEDQALKEAADQGAAWHQIVMLHGSAMVRRLREFSAAKRITMLQETNRICAENALHIAGPTKQFVVPSWSPEPLSGGQVVGLMVFGAWVHLGEREDLAAGLLADWPEILDAKKLGYLDQ